MQPVQGTKACVCNPATKSVLVDVASVKTLRPLYRGRSFMRGKQ